MAAEIKLTKTDESPWGFRLTGGRDFGTPLTIIKVAANSVAGEAGLQVGDILVKINEANSHDLTHKEAQDVILGAGNSVSFAVLRGNLNLAGEIIDRLTPLPLRDFKTPEPILCHKDSQNVPLIVAVEPVIEIIPIKDLEPEQLQQLGLNPLPEDFLEKALRDPSPLPEVRPLNNIDGALDVLDVLEQLELQDIIKEQAPEVSCPPPQQPTEAVSQDTTGVTPEPVVTLPDTPDTSAAIEPPQPELLTKNVTSQPVQPPVIPGAEPISETEFAELMSGKTEVLEAADGKNALGVDFKKYEPQAEFLKKSQVFKTLQDNETPEMREEREKRWTTFMDKPKNPKPIPKPKPNTKPSSTTPDPTPVVEVPVPVSEPTPGLYEIPSEEEFEALVRLPTPPPIVEEPVSINVPEETESEENNVKIQLEEEQKNLQEQLETEKQLNPAMFGEEKSEIELQLEEIQRQLQAIQQLPFEIQQHLSLVQEQLNKIVQHRLHEQCEEIPSAPRPSMVEETGLLVDANQIQAENLPVVEEVIQEISEHPLEEETSEEAVPKEITEDVEEKKAFKLRAEEEPAILPPPKKEKPRKKRPFLGLGPAPRPLVLPGGRIWRTPKDAYNEEFIAETLSAQAEIITGTTLGVNFRRYEPKQHNLNHLRDSITYKMIHDLEDPEIVGKGLAARAEIVPALQDYQQQSAPSAI